jgi:hypothetical protein
MLELYDKHSGRKEIIYAILDDDHGYPKFLIRKNNQWIYKSAKHYFTEKERRHKAYTSIEEHEIQHYGAIQIL